MRHSRRRFLHLAASAALIPVPAYVANAQTYPSRPARIVVGFAAGGSNDIIARLIGQWLSERLGQSFIIENRPGAGTNIATEAVVHAPPDGYTLLLSNSANAINASLYEKLRFDFLRDTASVAGLVRQPLVMVVHPSVPAKTIPQFITYAKANPNKITLASAGNGSTPHLAGELFKTLTGIEMVHVPYRGAGPALTDLLGGQVQIYFAGMAGAIEYIRTGKLRAFGVTTATRSESLPNIPAIDEFVPSYEASGWFGISAPRKTPAEIVDRLNKEINAAFADNAMRTRFTELGGTALPGSPIDFGDLIADETEKWGKVIRAAGIKPE